MNGTDGRVGLLLMASRSGLGDSSAGVLGAGMPESSGGGLVGSGVGSDKQGLRS